MKKQSIKDLETGSIIMVSEPVKKLNTYTIKVTLTGTATVVGANMEDAERELATSLMASAPLAFEGAIATAYADRGIIAYDLNSLVLGDGKHYDIIYDDEEDYFDFEDEDEDEDEDDDFI